LEKNSISANESEQVTKFFKDLKESKISLPPKMVVAINWLLIKEAEMKLKKIKDENPLKEN